MSKVDMPNYVVHFKTFQMERIISRVPLDELLVLEMIHV